MKIIIFSDTHLGRKNFKVAERENDFFNSFSSSFVLILKNELIRLVLFDDVLTLIPLDIFFLFSKYSKIYFELSK